MPLNHTSLNILDKQEPVELVLEIPSFAGGENTIGEDQELKVNEARTIQNWDSISLGGMIRSAGFTLTASNNGGIDANTILMLHMDGTNGSTTFTDSETAGTAKTITAVGSAQISTTTPKFGTGCGLFINGDYLTVAHDSSMDCFTGNFTMDFWVKSTTDGGSHGLWYNRNDGGTPYLSLSKNSSDKIVFTDNTGGFTLTSTTSVTIAKGYTHIEVTKSSTNYYLFIDGNLEASGTHANFTNPGTAWTIGSYDITTAARSWNGRIDEFRFSNTARNTASFTVQGASYTAYSSAVDLLLHHYEGSSTRNYVIEQGDLLRINSADLTVTDAGAFTSGVLCHGVTAGSKAWITNSVDNLKYTTIAGSITVPASIPPSARSRIYFHKQRLIAEGGGVTVYGSRVGSGTWTAANAWSSSGDAWSIDMPDLTQGCVPSFPTSNEVTIFTETGTYSLYNFPNIAYRPIDPNRGCSSPYSIALGNEGVFFLSKYPKIGVFLWDGSTFTNLTIYEDWVSDINFSNRIFGTYKENKYYITYSSTADGFSYPNRMRVYDTRFGRWMERPINIAVADNFGYPAVIAKPSNQLYIASSRQNIVYQLENGNSDNGQTTIANYKTKDFSSKDFTVQGQSAFPLDEVRLKLLKASITYYASTGIFTLAWTSDRGLHSGSQIYTSSSGGDLINTTFIVNTSLIASPPPTKTQTKSFGNGAIGRRFDFQLLHNGTGDRTKIKKIKIFAIALEEG